MLATVDGIMIAQNHLNRIAAWSRDLSEREIDIARAGISERSYHARIHLHARR